MLYDAQDEIAHSQKILAISISWPPVLQRCKLVDCYKRSDLTCCCYLQGTLKDFSETMVTTYRFVRYHNPAENNTHEA